MHFGGGGGVFVVGNIMHQIVVITLYFNFHYRNLQNVP
jgi:hypothetical protein